MPAACPRNCASCLLSRLELLALPIDCLAPPMTYAIWWFWFLSQCTMSPASCIFVPKIRVQVKGI